MTTATDLCRNAQLRHHYPVLALAAEKLGSVQIRNVATIGGNLCNASPCADTAVALLVLEAQVRLVSPTGARMVPIEQFFLGPGQTCAFSGEIMTEIILPPPDKSAAAFFKEGRVKMDIAVASLAVAVEMEGDVCRRLRLAAGSVAPVPLRLTEIERMLEGQRFTRSMAEQAKEAAKKCVSPISYI